MFSFLLCFFLQNSRGEFSYAVDSYFYGQKSKISESTINPQNGILKLNRDKVVEDLRAELKWSSEKYLLVVRPRFVVSAENSEVMQREEYDTKSDFDLTDAFFERRLSDFLTSTAGLQVFQWGPAEFLNPSNPFYHFSSQQRSVIHKEKGKILLRLNYSPSKDESMVFVAEPFSNNEAEWISDEKFTAKFALKFEKILNEVSDYVGVVAGTGEKNIPFVGEYFSFSPAEGFSLYGDAKHSSRKGNFSPEFNGSGFDMIAREDKVWPVLAVLGVRWEADFDTRLEYIHNSAGYSKKELVAAISSASNFVSPLFSQNLNRFLRPGLELPGRDYLYLSHRVADPLSFRDLNAYARVIWSLQDDSHLAQFEMDQLLGEDYMLFSNFGFALGPDNSEFRLTNAWQVLLGLKWGI